MSTSASSETSLSRVSSRKPTAGAVSRKSPSSDVGKKKWQNTAKRIGSGLGSNRTLDMFFSRAPIASGTLVRPGLVGPCLASNPAGTEPHHGATLAAREHSQLFSCPVCQETIRCSTEQEANRHINSCLDNRAQAPPQATDYFIDSVTLDDDSDSEGVQLESHQGLPPTSASAAHVQPSVQADFQQPAGDDVHAVPISVSANENTTLCSSEESQAADASIDFLNIDIDNFFSPIDDNDGDYGASQLLTTSSISVTTYESLGATGAPMAVTDSTLMADVEHTSSTQIISSNQRGKNRPCPFYKWIPGTQFTVDAFNFGAIPKCSAYFLTHFHSDHYMGLSGTFIHGPIYLSPITRALVRLQFPRVRSDLLRELPMNETTMVDGVSVTLLDANHCPGSVMFHFKLPNGQCHLHVGDFRAHPLMLQHPLLQQPIDTLFLDTTYLHPSHKFPPQHEVLDVLSEFVRRVANNEPFVVTRRSTPRFPPPIAYRKYNQTAVATSTSFSSGTVAISGLVDPYLPHDFQFSSHLHLDQLWDEPVIRVLVVVGSYTVGKEKVFMSIVQSLNTHFHCDARKWSLFQTYNDPLMSTRYTPNPLDANVHVVSMRDVNPQSLHAYLDKYGEAYSHLMAIKPTGWTFTDKDGKGGTKLDVPAAPAGPGKSTAATGMGPRQRSIKELWGVKPPPSNDSTTAVPNSLATAVHVPKRHIYMSDLSPQWVSKRVAVFGVPYSEHSSFSELRGFVRGLQVRKVVPTVGAGSAAMRAEMDKHLGEWQRDKWVGGKNGEGIAWETDEL